MKTLFKVVLSLAVAWLPLWGSLSSTRGAAFVSYSAAGGEYRAGEKSTAQGGDRGYEGGLCRSVRAARSFLMPHLSFSETATRGDDPVYVFGSKLRQQRFTQADFTLNKLNSPLPFGNFSHAVWGNLEPV